MKKILVTEKFEKISLYDLEGSIESAIEYLQNIWMNCPDGTNKISIEVETERSEYGDCSDYQYLAVYASRLETDKEYEKRMSKNKKDKLNKQKEKEEQEKAEYNRYLKLKEKYERL